MRAARITAEDHKKAVAFWSEKTHDGWAKHTESIGGFDVVTRFVMDDHSTDAIDYYGTFNNERAPGCIEHERGCRRSWDFFHPAYTVEERRRDLQRVGYAKGPAQEEAQRQVRETYKRVLAYNSDWGSFGIVSTVYKQGVELSETSCWGFELDHWGDDARDALVSYVSEAQGIQAEAVAEARETLASLCQCD